MRKLGLVSASLLVALLLGGIPSTSAESQKILLHPNGSDDTANLQAAVEKCVGARAACKIELAPGEFVIGPVVGDNFHGTITGAGMGSTILTLKSGVQIKDGFFFEPPSPSNPHPQILTFRGGDITVSDLTMRAPGVAPFPAYCYFPGVCDTALQSFIAVFALPGSTARTNSKILRVELLADDGTALGVTGSNTNNAIAIGGQFFQAKMEYGGTHSIEDCRFERASVFVLGGRGLDFVLDRNVFRKSLVAADAWQLDASEIVLTRNDIEASWTGLGGAQFTFYDPDGWVPQKPSNYFIAGNHIRISGNWPNPGEGIWVMDAFRLLPEGERKTMINAAIVNNTVEMGPDSLGGIGLYATDRTWGMNNLVTGNGKWGISAHGATNCALLANNVRNFKGGPQIFLAGPGEASGGNSGYATPVTATYPATSGCLVVAPRGEQVLDEGVDNRVIGH